MAESQGAETLADFLFEFRVDILPAAKIHDRGHVSSRIFMGDFILLTADHGVSLIGAIQPVAKRGKLNIQEGKRFILP